MELLEVKLGGICNIKSAHLRLGKNITSLVSTNNYGKSNLIRAFSFLLSFIHVAPAIKSKMMSDPFFIPLNKVTAHKNFFAELTFSLELSGELHFVKYSFEFEWRKNSENSNGGKRIVGESLSISPEGNHKKYSSLIIRREVAKYKASQTGRCDKHVNVRDNELLANKLLLEDSLYWYPILEALGGLNMYIERHLDVAPMYIPNFLISKEQEDFNINTVTDVPRMLYELQEKDKPSCMRLLDAFGQLFPDLKMMLYSAKLDKEQSTPPQLPDDVPYSVSEVIYYILVQDKKLNQPINFNMLSDGTKRLFTLLLYAVIAGRSGLRVIAIEEPENSIHPALLQDFLNVLSQLAGNCKILLTSHSPYILQYVRTEDIYIGRPNEYGLADFTRISAKKQKNLMREVRREGCNVGSYIFDLLSGGDSNAELLNSYLEDEEKIEND